MKIVFVKYTAKDAGNPTAGHNIERVNWIAAAGKEGRSLDEIRNHTKHYVGSAAKIAEHLNWDLKHKFIKVAVKDD